MSTFEKLENSRVKLTIEIDAETFANAVQKAYFKTAKHYNIPGFRKGKAPRKVIENMYGESVFYEEAFNIAYPDAYDAAIDEHELLPLEAPQLTIEQVGLGAPVVFTASVDVKPEVKLGQYKGIEVEVPEYNVTDEMVDAEIEKEREKLARFVDVERPVEKGDKVTLDYSGSVDGVKFQGGTAEGQDLTIGSGTFIPGFEDQLIGMKAGEHRDITVTFPEQYHAKELAGKEAVFAVDVKTIAVKELPELDDEFAKDISEYDTLEALREAKRQGLDEAAKRNAATVKENRVIAKSVEYAEIELPESMIERQISYMVNDISYNLSMQGLSFDDYLKYMGKTMDEARAEFRTDAEKRVRTQLVIDAIAKAESIKASADEVEAAVVAYAASVGQEPESFKAKLAQDDMAYFEDRVIVDKAVKMLVDSAVETAEKAEKLEPKKRGKKA